MQLYKTCAYLPLHVDNFTSD